MSDLQDENEKSEQVKNTYMNNTLSSKESSDPKLEDIHSNQLESKLSLSSKQVNCVKSVIEPQVSHSYVESFSSVNQTDREMLLHTTLREVQTGKKEENTNKVVEDDANLNKTTESKLLETSPLGKQLNINIKLDTALEGSIQTELTHTKQMPLDLTLDNQNKSSCGETLEDKEQSPSIENLHVKAKLNCTLDSNINLSDEKNSNLGNVKDDIESFLTKSQNLSEKEANLKTYRSVCLDQTQKSLLNKPETTLDHKLDLQEYKKPSSPASESKIMQLLDNLKVNEENIQESEELESSSATTDQSESIDPKKNESLLTGRETREEKSINKELNYRELYKLKDLDKDFLNKLADMPEILDYIRKLENIIEKQLKKIIKWKRRAKQKIPITNQEVPSDISTLHTDTQVAAQSNAKLPCLPKGDFKDSLKNEPKSLVADITEAAENALQTSGFVYEETSGMYYDYNTGYYYNAEYRLYYDGNTGTYLSYNADTNSYEFHSQVQVSAAEEKKEKERKQKGKRKTKGNIEKDVHAKRQKKTDNNDEYAKEKDDASRKQLKSTKRQKRDKECPKEVLRDEQKEQSDQEEGECSESDADVSMATSSSSSSEEAEDGSDDESSSEEDDLSKQWPPCMRIIIEQTEDAKLVLGSLYIITCDGGSLGREGKHDILIKDINVSKHHLKFQFDKKHGKYMVCDLGSRNGTLLNGKRISASKQESDPQEVVHGSKIQIGSTVLLCHIHTGSQTCGHCEPGLLIQKPKKEAPIRKISGGSMSQRYKAELRSLKMKQGLLGSNCDEEHIKLKPGYTDRAHKRRQTVGSQNPYEKTESASVEKVIPSENKGFKLLQKMGWKEGQSLGKEGDGLLEPVPMVSNPGTAGIGNTAPIPGNVNLTIADRTKKVNWKKAQERFDKLPEKKLFLEDESD